MSKQIDIHEMAKKLEKLMTKTDATTIVNECIALDDKTPLTESDKKSIRALSKCASEHLMQCGFFIMMVHFKLFGRDPEPIKESKYGRIHTAIQSYVVPQLQERYGSKAKHAGGRDLVIQILTNNQFNTFIGWAKSIVQDKNIKPLSIAYQVMCAFDALIESAGIAQHTVTTHLTAFTKKDANTMKRIAGFADLRIVKTA